MDDDFLRDAARIRNQNAFDTCPGQNQSTIQPLGVGTQRLQKMEIFKGEGEEATQLLCIRAPGVDFGHWFRATCRSFVDRRADLASPSPGPLLHSVRYF